MRSKEGYFMNQNKQELINEWVILADESFEDAIFNLNNNHLKVVQNRLYYSIFYIVKALSAKEEFNTSKHGSLYSWFTQKYIKTGIFSKEMNLLYKNAFDNRDKSDYSPGFKPNKQLLEQDLQKAKDFIEEIKKYINTEG